MGHSDTVQIKKETDGYVEIEQKIGDSEKGWVYLGGMNYFCICKSSLFKIKLYDIYIFVLSYIILSSWVDFKNNNTNKFVPQNPCFPKWMKELM